MASLSWLQGFLLVHVGAEQFFYFIEQVQLVLNQSRGLSVIDITIWNIFANVATYRKLWESAVGLCMSVTLCALLVFSQQQISSEHAGCVARS